MPDLFTPGPGPTAAASGFPTAAAETPLLDAEKLHVYQLAVQFQTLATQLIPRQRGVLLATLRDQLDRASISIVLNTAGALLDLLLARHLVTTSLHREARNLIVRIVQMLTRLSNRMTATHAARRDV